MDSKMRPLYLVFENLDEMGDFVRIIFKNGDGKCLLYSVGRSMELLSFNLEGHKPNQVTTLVGWDKNVIVPNQERI